MSTDLINKVLRVGEGRVLKGMQGQVARINDLEPAMEALSDDELRARTAEFKARLAEGETLDDILTDAFATVREAGRRVLGMRLFDVQMIGAMTLHLGRIAEMKTGEGKTFAAVPAVYLNALTGRGVHLVTVNDYLASRDAEWMRPLYEFLGTSVGVIASMMPEAQRREAYAADATYGTNSEFGFDYLRDNMAVRLEDCAQRGHYFCIVDEVNSILIDEARTPLIISGVPEAATDTYYRFARIVPTLKSGVDYDVDEKHRAASPTESGVEKVEAALGIENLYLDVHGNLVNHLIQALKAHALYRKDKEYIVREGELLIVDEFTGRVLEGRRYSEGLHQALEAKEGLRIREENQTLATITLQNYFRMYEKLSGMTGTASTEANEFAKIYETDVTSIPTHRPMIRADENDFIFKTKDAKFRAVVEDIAERPRARPAGPRRHDLGRDLRDALRDAHPAGRSAQGAERQEPRPRGRHHRAGRPAEGASRSRRTWPAAASTSSWATASRDLGGLYIVGTERHESRRIDNQLRGRAGRQGDPGRSRFFLSAEDDLIRIFAGDRIYKILDRLGPGDDLPIEAKMLSKTVEGAQKKVEEQNFNIRKRVLDYDDVLNKQREVIYSERRRVLEGEDLGEQARDWIAELLVSTVDEFGDEESLPADWDVEALFTTLQGYYPMGFTIDDIRADLDDEADPLTREELLDKLEDDIMDAYDKREEELGGQLVRDLERWVLLQLIDQHWREHLYNMDYLREGIHLRALGQKDPLSEYRLEGHAMFDEMMGIVKAEFVRYMFHIQVDRAPETEEQRVENVNYSYQDDPMQGFDGAERRGRPGTSWTPTTRRPRSGGARRSRWSSSGCCPTRTRSAATTPARAAPARSTRGATAPRGAGR